MALPLTRRETFAALAVPFASGGDRPQRVGAISEGWSRGFNLPDQAPLRADLTNAQTSTLKRLHDRGMTHVRLAITAEFFLPEFSNRTTISAAKDDLTRAVERLLHLGYHVCVDMHPGADFQALQRRDPARAHQALLRGWMPLATHIKRWPPRRIAVELLNEPATWDTHWRPFVEKLASAVRAVLPDNAIIVGSAPYQRLDALTEWEPLADKNIFYACHYYDPMIFSHQGASWDVGAPWERIGGVPFPLMKGDPALARIAAKAAADGDSAGAAELREIAQSSWNAQTIFAQFAAGAAWSAKHNAPITINEFGVLKWKAPRASRLAWINAVRTAAEAHGFGWTHWDYATSFGLIDDDGAVDEGVMRALLRG